MEVLEGCQMQVEDAKGGWVALTPEARGGDLFSLTQNTSITHGSSDQPTIEVRWLHEDIVTGIVNTTSEQAKLVHSGSSLAGRMHVVHANMHQWHKETSKWT